MWRSFSLAQRFLHGKVPLKRRSEARELVTHFHPEPPRIIRRAFAGRAFCLTGQHA